jgi:hypothetical protein
MQRRPRYGAICVHSPLPNPGNTGWPGHLLKTSRLDDDEIDPFVAAQIGRPPVFNYARGKASAPDFVDDADAAVTKTVTKILLLCACTSVVVWRFGMYPDPRRTRRWGGEGDKASDSLHPRLTLAVSRWRWCLSKQFSDIVM